MSRNFFIDGRQLQAYGNLFLLRNPFKLAVVVHRSDSDEEFHRLREECEYVAANGGVIVSAFISQREKELRRAVESLGGKIILIHNRPLGERDKPGKHDFESCCNGKLLLLSPIDYEALPKADHPSRQQCLDMNRLATTLAAHTFPS